MTAIVLTPSDLVVAASLIVFDAAISLWLHLGLHRRIAVAALRMVVQLVAIGFVLRFVFALNNPAATLAIVVVMLLVAGREVASRPAKRLSGGGNYIVGATSVSLATLLTAVLALTTAIRPEPWFDPRYAIPLVGIILGNVLNTGSITLDVVLSGFGRERPAIEARLALGAPFHTAARPIIVEGIRQGMVPTINQMSAAGIVTLPGIMTGQILAGMDPIEAVKYQILLIFLLAGASGLAAVVIAFLAAARMTDDRQRLRLDRLRGR
jgi:putative ABC transport system permease protein